MENKKIFLTVILFFLLFLPFVLADCTSSQININTASAEKLDEIKWIGPVTAQNIINSRPFDSLDDLINVSGIGEIKLQDIIHQGLACVGNSNNNKSSNESEENNTTNEEINKTESEKIIEITKVEKKNITLSKINLNSKDINTNKNNSWISNYTLSGLIIFSILIIILLIIKTRNKNEFG